MGTDATEVVPTLPRPNAIKVHQLMCTDLMNLVDRVLKILPEIEAARPCKAGRDALCSINLAIEKAKSVLLDCSESSKLYLAISGTVIVLKCERIRSLLEKNLSQIQTMVPCMLNAQISRIVEDLRAVTFSLDSSEEEAGKVMQTLMRQESAQSDLIENSKIEALQIAASRLHITSQRDQLIEKRSIRKQLEKSSNNERKNQMLIYLLNLLKKYGNIIVEVQMENADDHHERPFPFPNSCGASLCGQSVEVGSCLGYGQHEAQTDVFRRPIPPEEFMCPISSRLMYDPVIIDSGVTFERMWIQKWFDEGHDTCPQSKKKLAKMLLTPNTAMKELILKWCMKHGIPEPGPCLEPPAFNTWEYSSTSITSLSNSMNDLNLPIDISGVSLGSLDNSYSSDSSHINIRDGLNLITVKTSDESHRCHGHADKPETDLKFLSELATHPWESQYQVVEDVEKDLKGDDQAWHSLSSKNFVEPLIRFLKDACEQHDVKAQRVGSQLLLAFVSKSRSGVSYLGEDAFNLMTSLLDSEVTEEALAILEVLSSNLNCGSKIAAAGTLTSVLKILDTHREFQEPAIKILYNMSSKSDVRSFIVSLDCIPKLVPFLKDTRLAKYCIVILKNLCYTEEGRVSVAGTDGCIASIVELLENGSCEDQEHAMAILLFLCAQRVQYCQLVMEEGADVFTSLASISLNGNDNGKVKANELLRLLRDIDHSDVKESPGSNLVVPVDSSNYLKEKKSSSKSSGIFGRIPIFSKRRSGSPKRKK